MKKLTLLILLISITVFSQQRLTDEIISFEKNLDLLTDEKSLSWSQNEKRLSNAFIGSGVLMFIISGIGIMVVTRMVVTGEDTGWNRRRTCGMIYNITSLTLSIVQRCIGEGILKNNYRRTKVIK